MRFIGWLAIASCAIGAGSAQAQWGGLVDRSDTLMTSTFAFTGSNPEAGTSNENYYDGDFADFDGDGLADRLLGSRYGLLLNTGGGLMVPIRQQVGFLLRGDPGAGGWGEDAAQFADVDGDGIVDPLMGGNGEPLSCQINSRWRFRTAWTRNNSALNIVNTDVEGDGDVDLVVSHAFCAMSACGGPVRFALLINDGTGTYTEESSARGIAFGNTDFIVGSVSGDVDGDGDFDIAIARGGAGEVILAINDGTGNYTQRPTGLPTTCSGFGQGMNFGDIDDDGDLDYVAGRCGMTYAGGHPSYAAVIAINDGAGNFTDESATRWVATGLPMNRNSPNAKLVDIDYDGDLDFLALQTATMTDLTHYFQVLLNDGSGSFTYDAAQSRSFVSAGNALGADVDITDLDGDGSYDVWLGIGGDRVRILMNSYTDPSGLPADVPRNVRVVSATGPGITVAWQAPPFAATARGYRVYRSTAPRLDDRDRELLGYVGFSPHQDEGFAAPITRHTTTADLGKPDVTLVPASDEVQFLDRTAQAGVTYYYSVSHVGTENTEGRQSAQVMGTLPAPATDTTGPDVTIVSPIRTAWSRYPRIVVHYGDESGVDLSTLDVSFDQALGARPANDNIADTYYRRDSGTYVAYIAPPLVLPMDSLVTMTVQLSDMMGNATTETVQFFAGVNAPMLPTAALSASPTSGMAPLVVDFDGSGSSDPDGKIVRWEWYFGDGETALGRQVSHSFQFGGTYDVTLVVRDGEGGVGTATQAITVAGPPPPDGGMCAPDCAGKVCGSDGCGGSCGSCGASESCVSGLCVCVPDCTGRSCGDDGCGGTCGSCAAGRVCGAGGMCLCNGSETDCGGSCVDVRSDTANCGACGNACAAGESCVASTCQVGGPDGGCAVDCTGRSCGDDGCGGTCGSCGGDQLCANGGQCLCMDSGTACGMECVDVRSDALHCGACGMACNAGVSCLAGRCEAATDSDGGTGPAPPEDVTGDCGCDVPGSDGLPAGGLSLGVLIALALTRRRARARRTSKR